MSWFIPKKYDKFEPLGEGTYATVFKGRSIETGDFVALKEIQIDRAEGTPSTAIREIALMKAVAGHPNIMSLLDVTHTDKTLTLVFEFCKEDLKHFIDRFKLPPPPGSLKTVPGPLPTEIAKDLSYQMLKGVSKMHEHHIIHRDLKPQNLLLTKDGVLKVADFGLAREFGTPVGSYSSEVVTLWYRPPDVLMGSKSYSTPIDIWSVGCIIAEMFYGVPLFRGRDNLDQLNAIFKITGTPDRRTLGAIIQQCPEIKQQFNFTQYLPSGYSRYLTTAPPEAIALIEKMLKANPTERISADEALLDPWFDECRARDPSLGAEP